MKKIGLVIILFLTAGATVFGVLISKFKSWDDLIQESPDIIIAKCTSTYGMEPSARPIVIMDGVIPSDIQILSVLKGSTKRGPSHLASEYWPYPGQEFVIFAHYRSDQFYTGYTAIESYRVMQLDRDFPLNTLTGKTLAEQIQLLFSNRLSNLNKDIEQDAKDKASLEKYLQAR
jgi:hypothetical protein